MLNLIAGIAFVMCSILSTAGDNDQLLTTKQRNTIESQLKNYDIPVQVLQMVARESNCDIDIPGEAGKSVKKINLARILPQMDNKSLVKLQQIFLECQDSFSHFRFAVYLSTMYSSFRYKFVINENTSSVSSGESFFDVCIYNRDTDLLVAVGGQNNDPESRPANNTSIQHFLKTFIKLKATTPTLRGAYYASSYGYDCDISSIHKFWDQNRVQIIEQDQDKPTELKFFEYKDKVYFEYGLPSRKERSRI